MLPLKENQKHRYPDTTCDRCGEGKDDEVHLLEQCPTAENNGRATILTHQRLLQVTEEGG